MTREVLGAHRLTFPLLRLAPGRRPVVERGSDACIAGYARSGNTFAYHAFASWNPDAVVAHHVHLVEQVARAVRLGVPCAALVRPPLDAVTSLLVFEEGRLRPGVALRGWLRYHRALLERREQVVVCRFADVLEDPGVVARGLNARYGTSFRSEPMDEAARRDLLDAIEGYHVHRQRRVSTFSVPARAKEARKPALREALSREPLLPAAVAVHDRLVGPG